MWHFLPESSESWGDFLEQTTQGLIKLSSGSFTWHNKTILADGAKGFQNARVLFAPDSHLFVCTNHRRDRAIQNLSKDTAKKYIHYVQDYSNCDTQKFTYIKETVRSWGSKHSQWVQNVGYEQQMPWLSPINLINGAFKTI